MKKELSIYLDLVRFSAAMVVFLGHAAGKLTGGFLWQLNAYLSASVMVFFVLSGFVIAFVYDTKEKTIKDYSIARLSRLSSIIYPALVLTIICDYIGISISPSLYFDGPWSPPNSDLINYLLSAFLVQNIWGLDLNPGINVPFWSLSYELMFYALFACLCYLKGKKKIIAFIIICLISGPDILIYFPIWLMGAAAYFLIKKPLIQKIKYISIIISLLSLAVFITFVPWINVNLIYVPELMIAKRNVLADYIFAMLFTTHLIFVIPLLTLCKPLLVSCVKPITYFASLTFALYLFHRPLIQVYAVFSDDLSSIQSRLIVIGGTCITIVLIGRWCENQKYPIKKWLVKHFN